MKDGSTEKQLKGFRIFKYSNSIGQHILHSPSGLRWHILVRGREKPCAVLPAPALQIDARWAGIRWWGEEEFKTIRNEKSYISIIWPKYFTNNIPTQPIPPQYTTYTTGGYSSGIQLIWGKSPFDFPHLLSKSIFRPSCAKSDILGPSTIKSGYFLSLGYFGGWFSHDVAATGYI
jgi:hypothetical protein